MVLGYRFTVLETFDWIKELDAVLISVEFRNAPENTKPQVEDCFAGLKWVAEHPPELGTDLEKIIVSGCSGSSNVATATVLLGHDRGSPKLYTKLLVYPMLDDRMQTVSINSLQRQGSGLESTIWQHGFW